MQIVINIDDNIYKRALVYKCVHFPDIDDLLSSLITAVDNGTPLPKGHGRIKDIDKIEWYGCTTEFDCPHKDRECKDCNRAECSKTQVDDIPTIIEADKVESEVQDACVD